MLRLPERKCNNKVNGFRSLRPLLPLPLRYGQFPWARCCEGDYPSEPVACPASVGGCPPEPWPSSRS